MDEEVSAETVRVYPMLYERNACNEITEKLGMESDDYVEKCFEKPQIYYRTISVFCDVDTVVVVLELW